MPLAGYDAPPTPRVRVMSPAEVDLWSLTVGRGFFEEPRLTSDEMDVGRDIAAMPSAECYLAIEEGEPAVRRTGSDLTIVTIGATLYKALETADILSSKYGTSAEVIDARFINPLRYEKILEYLRKTPAIRDVVGARNWITPCAEMEESFFPQKEWILDTIHERIVPLAGHEVTTEQGVGEMLRRNARGV